MSSPIAPLDLYSLNRAQQKGNSSSSRAWKALWVSCVFESGQPIPKGLENAWAIAYLVELEYKTKTKINFQFLDFHVMTFPLRYSLRCSSRHSSRYPSTYSSKYSSIYSSRSTFEYAFWIFSEILLGYFLEYSPSVTSKRHFCLQAAALPYARSQATLGLIG